MPQQILQEVDNNFIGLNSRLDPSNLAPGFMQEAKNVRLQRGTAQPRMGCDRLPVTGLNSLTMVGSGTYVNLTGQDNIVLVFSDRMYLYNTETNTQLGPYMFPAGRTISVGGTVDVLQALNKIYIFRGQEVDARKGTGGTSTTAGCGLTHAAIAAEATVTVTATMMNGYTHNYSVGDEVTIFNITDTQHVTFNASYIVTQVTGTTSFEFLYTNNTGTNINSPGTPVHACVVRVKPPLIWQEGNGAVSVAAQTSIPGNVQTTTGYTAGTGSLPPSDFGFYFQNRIVCKYADTKIGVSDILSEVFDFTLNNFNINQGGNDSIVGVLPWIENQFLVFMKKSIYIAYVEPTTYGQMAPPGENSSITVVTTQIGCLSRRSIASAGQFVFFLSGKGVHMLTPQLDLKLIGNTLPLSEPIDDFFDNLNYAAADKTVSSYYDNRFFMALPINGETRPNAILVYNVLNQNWESIDTYPTGLYIDNYAICQYSERRRQFILTNFAGSGNLGGIFLTDEYEAGDQFSSADGTPVLNFRLPAVISDIEPDLIPINASIRSREYTFENVNEKRFARAEYQFNNSAGDTISISARTHDTDSSEEIMRYTFTGEGTLDSTLRPRIALRGSTIDMEVQFLKGRPALKTAVLYAIVANRSMVSQE